MPIQKSITPLVVGLLASSVNAFVQTNVPFKCALSGNFISAWGLESKINKTVDVVPDGPTGNIFTSNDIELDIQTVKNEPQHALSAQCQR